MMMICAFLAKQLCKIVLNCKIKSEPGGPYNLASRESRNTAGDVTAWTLLDSYGQGGS